MRTKRAFCKHVMTSSGSLSEIVGWDVALVSHVNGGTPSAIVVMLFLGILMIFKAQTIRKLSMFEIVGSAMSQCAWSMAEQVYYTSLCNVHSAFFNPTETQAQAHATDRTVCMTTIVVAWPSLFRAETRKTCPGA